MAAAADNTDDVTITMDGAVMKMSINDVIDAIDDVNQYCDTRDQIQQNQAHQGQGQQYQTQNQQYQAQQGQNHQNQVHQGQSLQYQTQNQQYQVQQGLCQQNQADQAQNLQYQTQYGQILQYNIQQGLNRQFQTKQYQRQQHREKQYQQLMSSHQPMQQQQAGKQFQDQQYQQLQQRQYGQQGQSTVSSQQLLYQQQCYDAQPSTSSDKFGMGSNANNEMYNNGYCVPNSTNWTSTDVANYAHIQQSQDNKRPSGAWAKFCSFNRNGQLIANSQQLNYQWGSTSAGSNAQSCSYGAVGGVDNHVSINGPSWSLGATSNNMLHYATNSSSGNWPSCRFAASTSPDTMQPPLSQILGAKQCSASGASVADAAGVQMNQPDLITLQMQHAAPASLPIVQVPGPLNAPVQHVAPIETLTEIIARIILSQVPMKIFTSDLYTEIESAYPYYKESCPEDWQTKVRHLLSSASFFVKDGPRTEKGFPWAIHTACVGQFQANDFKRSRANRAIKAYNAAAGIQ